MIGEPLALDLVNTRTADADLLTTPDQLADWLRQQAERLPEPPSGRPTTEELRRIRQVREHIAAVIEALLHNRRPTAAALRGLENAQSAAPGIRQLQWDGTALTATARRAGPAAARIAAALAESAVELLGGPAIARLKQCEADDCVLLFLPAHPRRRWCSPQRCGNRIRVARYYDRHSSAKDVTSTATPKKRAEEPGHA